MESTPELRPDLAELPSYKAGARARGAVSLASNEAPFGPLPGVTEAIARAAVHSHRYPDPAANLLLERLAAHAGVSPDQIALGTGSVAICQQITTTACSPGDEVVYAWRSFEAYPIVTRLAHAHSVHVPLLPDGRHDLAAMAAAVTDRTRVVFVCTPNNPTGPVVTMSEMQAFLRIVPDRVLVVIDEAYYEYAAGVGDDPLDSAALVEEHPHVLVLRTFSKAYGLAGLRVGYGIGSAPVVAALRKAATPFGVNHLAQEAAVAALDLQDELAERVATTAAERERLIDAARDLGFSIPDSGGNFYWIPLGQRSEAFAQACLEVGVTVRAFPGEGVRVTVGERWANDVVLGVLAQFAVA